MDTSSAAGYQLWYESMPKGTLYQQCALFSVAGSENGSSKISKVYIEYNKLVLSDQLLEIFRYRLSNLHWPAKCATNLYPYVEKFPYF